MRQLRGLRLNSASRTAIPVQGGLDTNKISDLGADFGIIVRSLLELDKSGALKPSFVMS